MGGIFDDWVVSNEKLTGLEYTLDGTLRDCGVVVLELNGDQYDTSAGVIIMTGVSGTPSFGVRVS